MAIDPLHVRLRAAAFAARTNPRLSALLLEAAAAVPRPKGDEEPRRDTMAVLAAHAAREDVKTSPMGPPQLAGARAAYGVVDDPAVIAGALANCGHCGEEYALGSTHCPECSGRVA